MVAHLIASHLDGDLVEAVRLTYNELRGHYAFVAMSADEPGVLVGARKECPLVVGLGEDESFIASAIPAFLAETRHVQLVNDGEIVALTPGGSRFLAPDGSPLEREIDEVDWDDDAAEKGGYETFMLKEIHEQADAVAETVADRVAGDEVDLGDFGIDDDFLRDVRRVVIVACGTSYHAGLVGRYAIETWARRPVEMDIASEFRYRDPVLSERDLVIGISQSGETADTLAAMRLARERGAKVLAITNIMGSQATRDADGVIFTRAGLEIGVAATKTFLAQVAVMYLFALKLAQLQETLEPERLRRLCQEMREIPRAIGALVDRADAPMKTFAEEWRDAGFFLYLGRHIGLPVCLEGALKLKEISYIPTDAYAAGRDEARPHRAAGREHAGGVRGHRLAGAGQDALEHRRGPRSRSPRDGGRHRGHRPRGRARRGGRGGPADRLAAPASAGRDPAPAAGLSPRSGPGPERRPAAQPRQDRHGRVTLGPG